MAFITMICPNCGGQAQIEAGHSAMCPYCGNEMAASPVDTGAAFAQDVQYAPPPAQAAVQMQDPFLQQAAIQQQAAMPMQQQVMPMQPGGYAMQAPQYTQEQLAQAKKKRGSWHFMNLAMPAVQAAVLGLGVMLSDYNEDIGVPMILAWLMSLPVCGIISGVLRPDQAYPDKRPMFRSKVVQGIMQFIIGTAASAVGGGILYAILESMFG